jgi:hypothetical protein
VLPKREPTTKKTAASAVSRTTVLTLFLIAVTSVKRTSSWEQIFLGDACEPPATAG